MKLAEDGVMAAKVTIINQYYVPDTSSSGYLLQQIAESLAAADDEVTVITCQPSYGPPESWQDCPADGILGGVRVRRLWTPRGSKDQLPRRLLSAAIYMTSLTVRLLFSSDSRRVYLYCTNPPFLAAIGAFVSYLRRHRYVVLVHDAYPQIAVLTGRLREGGWIDRVWHVVNRLSFRRARQVIVLCQRSKKLLQETYQLDPQRVHVIHNWADELTLRPIPKVETTFAAQHGLIEPFTLLYSGNLGLYYEFDSVLDAAERLRDQAFRLVFIGAGGRGQYLADEIERRGLSNTQLHPYQPQEQLIDSLNSCDASLVSIARGVEGISFPSKLYTSLAVGKPIVAISEEDSELRTLVEGADCGVWSPVGDADSLVASLRRLMAEPTRGEQMGQKARDLFEERFTRSKSVARYQAVLAMAARE